MQLLICAATEMELQAIKATSARLVLPPTHSIKFLTTGVGICTATYALARTIALHKPGLVIQVGIAGTLDPQLMPGDVAVVKSDTLADTGVEEGGRFYDLFDLKLEDAGRFPWKDGRLRNPYAQWLSLPGLPQVRGITVSEISTDPSRIQHYQMKWGAQTESMEGAALHYVCLQEDVPFLQLRSISNHIGERNKKAWKMKEAIDNLSDELTELLDKILEL